MYQYSMNMPMMKAYKKPGKKYNASLAFISEIFMYKLKKKLKGQKTSFSVKVSIDELFNIFVSKGVDSHSLERFAPIEDVIKAIDKIIDRLSKEYPSYKFRTKIKKMPSGLFRKEFIIVEAKSDVDVKDTGTKRRTKL